MSWESDYQDAAHEAYRRLLHAQENRPSAEELERLRKERAAEERQARIGRLRRSIA